MDEMSVARKAQRQAEECGCGCWPSDHLPADSDLTPDEVDRIANIDYVAGDGGNDEGYLVTVTDRSGTAHAEHRFLTKTFQKTGAPAIDWARQWVAAWYPYATVKEG